MSKYSYQNTSLNTLFASGNTNSSSFSGLGGYATTSYSFENPQATGYQVSGTDIANSIIATYSDFVGGASTTNSSPTIPSWCNQLKVIVIGAGGGGGGGSGQNSNDDGSSGAGGGGGGQIAGVITRGDYNWSNTTNTFTVSIGGYGVGGGYQGNHDDSGYNANNPAQTYSAFYIGNNNTALLYANCGAPGSGGVKPSDNNEATNNTAGGTSGAASYVQMGVVSASAADGNIGTAGGFYAPGTGGTTNLSTNNSPTLNTNKARPSQSKTSEIDQTDIPGVGQGGDGGYNSSNDNGYPGQYGGPSQIRVYFLA